MDITIPLLPKSELSSLSSVAVQPGLCQTWSETSKTGFLTTRLIKSLYCRSTPCPNVKHGDEWGDPVQCENGDNCGYCHTRTEQQFHPEVWLLDYVNTPILQFTAILGL